MGLESEGQTQGRVHRGHPLECLMGPLHKLSLHSSSLSEHPEHDSAYSRHH